MTRPYSARVIRQPFPGQQFVRVPPSRQRGDPPQPCVYRGVARGEVVPTLVFWVLEIGACRQVYDRQPFANHKGLPRQAPLKNVEELIEPVFEKPERIRVGRWHKSPLKTVRRHIACQLVIIPEEPAQDFKLLMLVLTPEASIALRKPQQQRRRLG